MIDDTPALIDEVCTPDSSRFWAVDAYEPGRPQHAYDKQFVRDWPGPQRAGTATRPGPQLPSDVVARTLAPLRAGLRDLDRPFLRRLDGVTMPRVHIDVMLKDEILDPQGQAVQRARCPRWASTG